MFGSKPRNFSVHDATNSLMTGHLTSRDTATSVLEPRWMMYVHEAIFKRGRIQITASLVLKSNKIGSQKFKFYTDSFPARSGIIFVIDHAWNDNELPPF